jgi:hypothetical protein
MRKAFRLTSLTVLLIALGSCAWAQGQTQSLADAARANRKQKLESTQKVWTNDNIPTISKGLATEGATASESDAAKAPATDADAKPEAKKECDKTKDADCDKADAAAKPKEEDSAKRAEDYKKKLADLEKAAATLEKEASLNDREAKLLDSASYGDAGLQLRNPKAYYEAQVAHQKDADTLKKAIDDARKKIDDLKEQARKDGVSLN